MEKPFSSRFASSLAALTWLVCTLAIWLCAPPANGQEPAARRIAVTPPVVRLNVQGAEKPIELRKLDIKSDITGRLAWTTVEMTFYNPNARVLEGELQFPLLEGQTIAGFALSMPGVNGKETMREAVPVDKAKGRAVFEDVIRQRIDPALLEATQGNNFKLRVYPLNPGNTRTVRLIYSERLAASANGNALYRLPLAYGQVQNLELEIKVQGANRAPAVTGKVAGVDPVFRKRGGEYVARAETGKPHTRGGTLAVEISAAGDTVYVGEDDGKPYFYTEVAAPAAGARAAPKTLDVLWDASLSGAKRDHAKEYAFLDAFFAQLPDVRVRLQVVRNVAEAAREFAVSRGDWRALRKALESMEYDGATNLSAFDFKAASDLYFLFSDGLDNYSITPAKPPKAPLFALVSAPGAETARLRGLAANGGGVIDLATIDAKSAAARTMQTRPHIAAVEGGIGEAVWQEAPQGDAFLVVGIVRNAARPLRIVFGDGSAVERRLPADGEDADAVPYLWAAARIAHLEEEYDLNRGEIRRLGRAFRIPTRETSLIVLDRVEDYALHDIEPPMELKADYDRLRAQMRQSRGEPDKLARVLREWKARDAWWKRDFPKGKPARANKRKTRGRLLGEPPPPELVPGAMEVTLEVTSAPAEAEPAQDMLSDMARSVAPAPVAPAPVAPAPAVSERREVSRNKQQYLAQAAAPAPAPAPTPTATIALRPWTPEAAYIRRMKNARAEDLYRIYLDERPDFENSVAFYLDVSYELGRRGQEKLALRVLSNLAEMNLENRQILRVLGYRLLEAKLPEQAVLVFGRVLNLADDEPQSFRDLGLAHEAAGEHQLAIDNLYQVVERNFPRAWPGIEVIALTELNAIVATAPERLDTRRIDPRLLADRPLDLRVVLTWDSDVTDIDLHVIDPNQEEAYYGHSLTWQGGRVSPDNTVGYGPEEYTLRRAKPGKYRVEVNFYGHRQQAISEATTIQLDFFTGYGTRKAEKQSVTMRLKDAKHRIFVGEFEVK
ncbi:MAG: DUF2135 domain-containing protein [Azoarcus sp.]|jgi:hypothetical protein|nr:DUF2135 domain-containing protein [Azoarcus sp.]